MTKQHEMSRITVLVIVILAGLLGLQTYRAHQFSQRLHESMAVTVPAGATGGTADPGKFGSADLAGEADASDAKRIEMASASGLDGDEGDIASRIEAMIKREKEKAEANGAVFEGKASKGNGGSSDPGDASAKSSKKSSEKSDKKSDKKKSGDDAVLQHEVKQMLRRASDAIEFGDYNGAIDLLQQSIETDPSGRESYRTLAKLYHKLGMANEEVQTYADWTAQHPNDATPHYEQARAYLALGMNSDAFNELQQFQQLSADDLNSYSMSASMYRQLGLRAEEGQALQAWAAEVPNSIDARAALAQYYRSTGNREAALAEYQVVAQLTPQNADAHRNLANVYRQLQRYDDAQNELVTAMNLQPANMNVRMDLGALYRQTHDYDAALQTYYGVITDVPESTYARQAQRAANQIERQMQKPPKPPKPKSQM